MIPKNHDAQHESFLPEAEERGCIGFIRGGNTFFSKIYDEILYEGGCTLNLQRRKYRLLRCVSQAGRQVIEEN